MKIYIENQKELDWFNKTMETATDPFEGMTLEISSGCKEPLPVMPGSPKIIFCKPSIPVHTCGIYKMEDGKLVSCDGIGRY